MGHFFKHDFYPHMIHHSKDLDETNRMVPLLARYVKQGLQHLKSKLSRFGYSAIASFRNGTLTAIVVLQYFKQRCLTYVSGKML